MGVELLQRAVAASAPVVDAVAPAQYELPTPCASWTVTDLLDHVIGAQQRFVDGARRRRRTAVRRPGDQRSTPLPLRRWPRSAPTG